jgi:hypothetical protein
MDFAILAYLTLQDIGATGLMQGVKIAGHKAFRPVSFPKDQKVSCRIKKIRGVRSDYYSLKRSLSAPMELSVATFPSDRSLVTE